MSFVKNIYSKKKYWGRKEIIITCDLEKENNIHLKGGRKEKEKSFYKNLFLALIFKMVWK